MRIYLAFKGENKTFSYLLVLKSPIYPKLTLVLSSRAVVFATNIHHAVETNISTLQYHWRFNRSCVEIITCYFTFRSQNRLFIPKFTLFVLLSCIDQLISATTTDCVVRKNFPTHQCWRVKKLLTLGLLKEDNCGFATAMIKLTKTSRYIKRPDSGQGTTVLH